MAKKSLPRVCYTGSHVWMLWLTRCRGVPVRCEWARVEWVQDANWDRGGNGSRVTIFVYVTSSCTRKVDHGLICFRPVECRSLKLWTAGHFEKSCGLQCLAVYIRARYVCCKGQVGRAERAWEIFSTERYVRISSSFLMMKGLRSSSIWGTILVLGLGLIRKIALTETLLMVSGPCLEGWSAT